MSIGFNSDIYCPAGSMICRLDARAKIIFLFFVFIVIFSVKTWISVFILFLFYGFTVFVNRVPLGKLFSGVKTWFLIIVFLCAFPFFATGGRRLVRIGFINITYEGVRESGMLFSKLFLASLGARILTATTTIKQIISAFQYFFSPFKVIGLSSGEIGLVISIGAGYIRFFAKEARQIVQTGILRGKYPNTGSIFLRPSISLFLFQAIITRMYLIGYEIEESLRLYGYSRDTVKTSFYEQRWKLIDWIPIVCVIFLGTAVFYFNRQF